MKGACVVCGVILVFIFLDGRAGAQTSVKVGENCTLSNATCPAGAVCDPRQNTPMKCLIKAGSACNTSAPYCVLMASCDSASSTCVCNTTDYVANGICLSKSGRACSRNDTCVPYSTCTSSKCTCSFGEAGDGSCKSSAVALLVHPFAVMAFTLAASYLEQSLLGVA